jgi:hypothetical protein
MQRQVNEKLAIGVVGDFYDNTPRAAHAYKLAANGEVLPEYGKVFTAGEDAVANATEGTAEIGGSGEYLGVAVHSKEGALRGGLEASMKLPNGAAGTLAYKGNIVVAVSADIEVGYIGIYNTTTGDISGIEKGEEVPSGYEVIPNAVFAFFKAAAGEIAVLSLNGSAVFSAFNIPGTSTV